MLSPAYPDQPTDHAANSKTEKGRAWSFRLLDLCLLLAVAYPLLAALIDWAATGDASRIGALEVIPAEPDWWRYWPTVGLLVPALYFFLLAWRAR